MKKISTSLFLATALLMTSQSGGEAADSKLVKVDSKIEANSVQLGLEGIDGEYFKVFRDGEKVWEGTQKSFTDDQLDSDFLYNYKIGVYKNDELTDIITHKIKTKSKNLKKINNINTSNTYATETEVTTTVGKGFVTLEWDKIQDDDGLYEIYRDGELLGKVSTSTFTDDRTESNNSYLYEIVAAKEISNDEKQKLKAEYKSRNIKITKENKELLFNEIKTVGKVVQTTDAVTEESLKTNDLPKEFVDDSIQTLGIPDSGADVPAYIFRYQTYIPFASVDNPNQIHETQIGEYGTRLKGDNRGNDAFSNKYRSRVDVFADWWYPNLFGEKTVGESILYDSSGNILLRGTASTDGIKVTKDLVTSTKMMWRVNHDVGVPFSASYPNITYYYEGTVYKNGTFSLRGSHDKAPNHELYAGNAYTDIRPLTAYTYSVGSSLDFAYLVPGTPQKYFEVSM